MTVVVNVEGQDDFGGVFLCYGIERFILCVFHGLYVCHSYYVFWPCGNVHVSSLSFLCMSMSMEQTRRRRTFSLSCFLSRE